MELRNIFEFAFDTCQAFENVAVVFHPVQRVQNLSLISFHLAFERIEALVDRIESLLNFGIERFKAPFDSAKPGVERADLRSPEVLDQLPAFLDGSHPQSLPTEHSCKFTPVT